MSFLKRLRSLADAKILRIPSKKEPKETSFEKDLKERLGRVKLKGSSHIEKMSKAADELHIKYRQGSIFYMLDAIDAYIAKHAADNHELSKIVFKIKGLKAAQRRDLSTDAPAKEIEQLREKAIALLTASPSGVRQ